MFYQMFFSPQVKRCTIITYKQGIYELPHELRNNLENVSKPSKPNRMIPQCPASPLNQHPKHYTDPPTTPQTPGLPGPQAAMNGRPLSPDIALGVRNSCKGILKALLIPNSVNWFGY